MSATSSACCSWRRGLRRAVDNSGDGMGCCRCGRWWHTTLWTIVVIVSMFMVFVVLPTFLLNVRRNELESARIALLERNEIEFIRHLNRRSVWRNMDRARLPTPSEDPDGGPDAGDDPIIPIVVYVYDRAATFRTMLAALRGATGIENTVLVVSQDGFVADVAHVVDEIDFMPVKYLVHPKPRAESGSLAGLRAHWWWLMEQVFRDPFLQRLTRGGPILFLEEDHVVSPDFYLVAQAMARRLVADGRPDVWGFSLNQYLSDASLPNTFEYQGGHSNTAYAFNASAWACLVRHRELFMAVPDGWDWSWYALLQRSLCPQVHMAPKLSRVRNIGDVGLTMTPETFLRSGYDKQPVSESRTFDGRRFEMAARQGGELPSRMPLLFPEIDSTVSPSSASTATPAGAAGADGHVRRT